MAQIQRVGDLEIGQDLEFQRRSWKVERVGWVIMLLVLLAGALGLMGGMGPLNQATAASGDGSVRLDYEPFARLKTVMRLQLHLQNVSGGTARVRLNQAYLSAVQIQNIAPQPDSVAATSDGLVYVFQLAEAGVSPTIEFYLQPERIGTLNGEFALEGSSSIRFSQFVYP